MSILILLVLCRSMTKFPGIDWSWMMIRHRLSHVVCMRQQLNRVTSQSLTLPNAVVWISDVINMIYAFWLDDDCQRLARCPHRAVPASFNCNSWGRSTSHWQSSQERHLSTRLCSNDLTAWQQICMCQRLPVADSGVVEGECGGTLTPFPELFCRRNIIPPPTIRTWGNADTVAFPQIGLQRKVMKRKENEKSRK